MNVYIDILSCAYLVLDTRPRHFYVCLNIYITFDHQDNTTRYDNSSHFIDEKE
jgi:hypothetical protein